jgi:predicted RNase H-like HicB family nuclease
MQYSVIVEQRNGMWRAVIPTLADLSVEGASFDEALRNVRQAAEAYLSNVVVTTIEVSAPQLRAAGLHGTQNEGVGRHREAIERELAIAAELNSPETEMRLGSLQSIARAAADCRINTESEMFRQYEAELDAEKERQRAEAEREADQARLDKMKTVCPMW